MPDTQDVIRVVTAVEKFLPIVLGLVRDLKGLLHGSRDKSVEEILAEADANWQQVISAARKELGQ